MTRASVRAERTRLAIFAALLLAAGVALTALAGPPRMPAEPPKLDTVLQVLAGTTLPLDGVALLLVDVAWVLWTWTIFSLLLQVIVAAAEVMARGRVWVRWVRAMADRLSLPLARRSVAAAFAVQLISRGVSVASAQPLPPPSEIVAVVEPESSPDAGSTALREPDDSAAAPIYVVRRGDTLWSIAEQAYGSGAEYRRLLDANLGRTMPDGRVFSAHGVIQPGWHLVAPGANTDVDVVDGERWYTTRTGDTLSSIAAKTLGDSDAWRELFELNRGATSADGLHTLVDADTIWPGLRLQLPPTTPETDPPGIEIAPEPEPSELAVAAAPPRSSAPVAPITTMEPTPEATPPPLLRTAHALQPVVLDPADAPTDAPVPEPISDPAPVGAEAPVPVQTLFPVMPMAAGGLGLAAVAGLAVGARRMRRKLRPLPSEPESEVVVQGGFAEAELARDLTRGLHGVGFDPLVALVAQLQLFLDEHNLTGVGVVAIRHGRSSTTLTLRCGLAEQPMLVDLAPTFAEQLEAECEPCVSVDQDVLFRLVRLRKSRLLPTADAAQSAPCLVPLGVLYDRQTYAAAWDSLDHVLIASLPGHGSDTILASLAATLTARRSPEQLRMWLVAAPRSLPSPVFDLPHLQRLVDPGDPEALALFADELRAELDRRANRSRPHADLLIVVPELASLGEHAAGLALLAGRAVDLGVRFVVASADPEQAVASPLTPCFGTRMVLRMQTEEASVALLGVADAAFLGGGGRLLLRLDGREPVELYGYQVAPEHLERLVKVMRSSYPAPPAEPPAESAPPPPLPPTAQAPHAPPPSVAETTDEPPVGDRLDAGASLNAAPIQVSCFGRPSVTCAGEPVWPHTGGDAKPWELLLFLACQPPEGTTREAVMAALWPEDDAPEDPAHRFRQLRYRLRRHLQQVPDAPDSDGIHFDRRVLRLDPGIVYSDACEFLTCVRAARLSTATEELIDHLQRARALYVGDLLDGPDVRRYAWVDERDDSGVTLREHFRRLFQNATMRLAEAYAESGRCDASVELYRELTELDPADERLWQALFRLHAARGDRRELIAEERRLRQALRDMAEDLDSIDGVPSDQPGRETIEEYQRLLSALREPEPAAV